MGRQTIRLLPHATDPDVERLPVRRFGQHRDLDLLRRLLERQ